MAWMEKKVISIIFYRKICEFRSQNLKINWKILTLLKKLTLLPLHLTVVLPVSVAI